MDRDPSINARLPEDLEEKTIGGMLVGEQSWSVPWAMEVGTKRRLWLKATFSGEAEAFGTVSMLVTRTPEGFVVDLSQVIDHEWSTSYAMDADELDNQDPDNPSYLPVIELIR